MRRLIGSLALLLATYGPSVLAQDSPVLVGTVARVVDGDTIKVDLASGPITVRLHGIDTPERGQPGGSEATSELSRLVLAKAVQLEPFEQDRYSRLIAIVYLDKLNINAELVKLGHAWAYRKYMRKADAHLCELEREARKAKRGLWNAQAVAPWEWRKRASKQTDYSRETAAACVQAIQAR